MGQTCTSFALDDDSLKSFEIDKQIKADRKNARATYKLLLLGTGGSGKSTFFRQLKIIHGNGIDEETLAKFSPNVRTHLIESIRHLISESEQRRGECMYDPEISAHVDFLMHRLSAHPSDIREITPEIAEAVKIVWADEGIQNTWDQRVHFRAQILDAAPYFFENVDRFVGPDYCPTQDDYLRCRVQTIGMYEDSFRIRESKFNVFDVGGQRSERKKWIHCFEGVKAVIYVVAINEYDMATQEDAEKNRLLDSLEVFQEIVTSQFLDRSDFILFLNKTDLLKEKVAKSPLTQCFPEYTGAQTYEEVSQYIAKKFEACTIQSANSTNKLSVQFTCATAPKTMLEKLFDAMVRIILDAALDEGGFV